MINNGGMTVGNQLFVHCLIGKRNCLNMISKISATHNTIVITVNVYMAIRKMVFSKCSGTKHFIIVNFFPRDPASHR